VSDHKFDSLNVIAPNKVLGDGFTVPITVCVRCGENRIEEFKRCWCGSVTVRRWNVSAKATGERVTTPWPIKGNT
jgi:hypothetical protein